MPERGIVIDAGMSVEFSAEISRNFLGSRPCPIILSVRSIEDCCLLQAYFTWWVVLALGWALIATTVATLVPLIEARRVVARVLAAAFFCLPASRRTGVKQEARHAPVEGLGWPDTVRGTCS